ncbi:hypothetical protein [Acaryochloris thomasi]|nr:hypothetical protein [Acaryochloris thomasi]
MRKWAIEAGLLAGRNPWVGLAKAIKPELRQKVKPFVDNEDTSAQPTE